jgi:hypothetical protein
MVVGAGAKEEIATRRHKRLNGKFGFMPLALFCG